MLLRLVRSGLAATLFVSPGLAAEIRVPADHPTLVDAVVAAVDGDVILLAESEQPVSAADGAAVEQLIAQIDWR